MDLYSLVGIIFFVQCILLGIICIVLGVFILVIKVGHGLPLMGNLVREQLYFKINCIAALLIGAALLLPGFTLFEGILSGLAVVLAGMAPTWVEYLRTKWLKLPGYYLKDDWFEWRITLRKQQFADNPADVLRKWPLAVEHVRRGEYEKAVPELQEVIASYPTHYGAVYWIAQAYLKQGEPEKAAREIQAWIRYNVGEADPVEITPERPWILIYPLLGLAYCKVGRVDEGIKICEKAVAVSPRDVITLQPLAEALMEAKQYDLSIARYHEALKHGGRHMRELYVELASAYMAVNNLKSAASAIEKAIERAGYLIYPEDYENLIKVYQSMGDEVNASKWRRILEERMGSAGHWKQEGSEDGLAPQ